MAQFKTRARAVDMLGRQQIAGVPNAISELFKNAHDAYADRVEVDYFRSDGLFVLRDDGLGMTRDDFENRWLTLGTESKVIGQRGLSQPAIDKRKKKRPVTGEKGIGRLAIAAIGPQVLVLTRSKRDDQLGELVVAFINWGLFEAPGINLDQIDIPVSTFPGGTLPSEEDIQIMVKSVKRNVEKFLNDDAIESDAGKQLIRNLDKFTLNLEEIADILTGPSLLGDGHGTHFYLLPTRDDLATDIENDVNGGDISRLRKLLLGFNNTMTTIGAPQLTTAFRYWTTDEEPIDIIEGSEFFTLDEMETSDHHIKGQFDEYGQFIGTVKVYKDKPVQHVVPWLKAAGRKVACGAFTIDVAYVQGNVRESLIPPEEHARLIRKLNRIGGLYIYQDAIRVLPYGDSDVDFLEIEKRRSQGIKHYFFSYRRMFGVIEITRERNRNLVEKAGREGFQDNQAYREFRSILMNFFVQLAADFFRVGGDFAEPWKTTKDELTRLGIARKEQEKQSLVKRRQFSQDLNTFFERVENGTLQASINELLPEVENQLARLANEGPQSEQSLMHAEANATKRLDDIRKSYKIQRPREIGLTKQLSQDWNAYQAESNRIEHEIFEMSERRVQELVEAARQRMQVTVDQRHRIQFLVREVIDSSTSNLRKATTDTNKALDNTIQRVRDLTKKAISDLRNVSGNVEAEIGRLDINSLDILTREEQRNQWTERIIKEADRYLEAMQLVQTQLQKVEWYQDSVDDSDKIAALEGEFLALQETADANLQLSQLGMAIEIINHEFENTINAIRRNIRRLKRWAEINPDLNSLYEDIRSSFEHLDGYLTLFTPLHRRLYRTSITISGKDIARYLQDLFEEKMERHNVRLDVTPAFKEKEIEGYPSTFYPVFINLIDNAVFWLKDRPEPREIHLDATEDAFIISDNGPGISNRDKDTIFEPGFTRKPGGLGLGLYIAREVLKKEGFSLDLADNEANSGTIFMIRQQEEQS